MITGFNTDVEYNGKVYHVQTEDKGLENPYIESLVYSGGAILFSKRTPYKEKLASGISEKEIRAIMENQHRTIIAAIKKGKLDEKIGAVSKPSPEKTEVIAEGASPEISPSKSLDEVILEYLSTSQIKDQLEIIIPEGMEFFAGEVADFHLKTSTSISGHAVDHAEILVKILTTFHQHPIEAFKGKTNEKGVAHVKFAIPSFNEGAAAVVIIAKSTKYGNTEYKQLVKKRK